VQVAGAAWCATMRIVTGVGDLVQKIGHGHTCQVLSGRTIERSGDAVCGLHCARGDVERGFLGLDSKPRSTGYDWFGIKTNRTVFSDLASKPVATVFSGLALKLLARVFRFGVSKSATLVW
jgi:hypothetical protein